MWLIPIVNLGLAFALWVFVQNRLQNPRGPLAKVLFTSIMVGGIVLSVYLAGLWSKSLRSWDETMFSRPTVDYSTPPK
jgi:hypothetical protein